MQDCDDSTVDGSSNNIKLRGHLRQSIQVFIGKHDTSINDIIDALSFNIIIAFSKVDDADYRSREIVQLCDYLKNYVNVLNQCEGAHGKVL